MTMAILVKPHEKLVQCRLKAKMTQKQVAEAVGVDQTAISKYERGLFTPTPDKMKKFSKLYGVPIEWLFFEDN